MSNYIILAFFPLILVACMTNSSSKKIPCARFEKRVGREAVKVLQRPIHVTISKIFKDKKNLRTVYSEERILTPQQIEILQELVLNDEGYFFDRQKKCLFIPEIALVFDNNKEVSLFIDMQCNQIKIVGMGQSTLLDYDPIADEFNTFIQSVKKEEHEENAS